MDYYTPHDAYGGCFTSNTIVYVLVSDRTSSHVNWEFKFCQDVQVGDIILTKDVETNSYSFTIVDFVVVHNYNGPIVNYDDDIKITLWHPVWNKKGSKFIFPCNPELSLPIDTYNGYVYTFALRNKMCVCLGDSQLPAITLGHNISWDPVAKHPFLGTDAVIKNLQYLSETNSTQKGHCSKYIYINNIIRDTATKLICQFI